MLPKGILFDLDDTIIAYSAVAGPTWQKLCDDYARQFALGDPEVLFDTIMEISHWYWSDPERHRIGRNDLDHARRETMRMVARCLKIDERPAMDMADDFSVQREAAVYLFDHATETLAQLERMGVRLAMMTNGQSHKQRAKIDRFDLAKYFDAILVEGEMGFGKPDPAVYHKALDALNLVPQETWAVGDNLEWDVAGPQKLSIFGIWNDHEKVGLPPDASTVPDRIIHNISELV